jgi:hypothetical protein
MINKSDEQEDIHKQWCPRVMAMITRNKTTMPQPTTWRSDKTKLQNAKQIRKGGHEKKNKNKKYNVNDNTIMQCSQNTNEKIQNKAPGWVGVFNFCEEMQNVNNC